MLDEKKIFILKRAEHFTHVSFAWEKLNSNKTIQKAKF